jgi:hypothetical protein
MITQIPGPGTHPADWMPDYHQRPVRHDYIPHGKSPPRRRAGDRKAHGRPRVHPVVHTRRVPGIHPRAAYWREYKRARKAMEVRS